MVFAFCSIQAVRVSGISNIASIEKNPGSAKVLIPLCLRLMLVNSVMVGADYQSSATTFC
jgi:hypothetical protein